MREDVRIPNPQLDLSQNPLSQDFSLLHLNEQNDPLVTPSIRLLTHHERVFDSPMRGTSGRGSEESVDYFVDL
jgi:hypothetical protein